jgi:hypothetical protein
MSPVHLFSYQRFSHRKMNEPKGNRGGLFLAVSECETDSSRHAEVPVIGNAISQMGEEQHR